LLVDEYVSHRADTAERLQVIGADRGDPELGGRAVQGQPRGGGDPVVPAGGPDLAAVRSTRSMERCSSATCAGTPPEDLPRRARASPGFHGGIFEHFEPIIVDQKPVGTFYLRSDLDRLRRRMA
jgi:hypothetical protein